MDVSLQREPRGTRPARQSQPDAASPQPGPVLAHKLLEIYERLLARYGPQHWWPGDGPFEVVVGAILTQAAAWTNVEKAIHNLKEADALSPAALRSLPLETLAHLVYPSGYYIVKARKLRAFAEHLADYGDSLDRLFSLGTAELRRELLSIWGVGEETADSIILYAAHQPVFVIDAYTRRIISRIGIAPPRDTYAAFQSLFQENLSRDERLFNDYHALLVRHGKETCRTVPLCDACCLRALCQWGQRNASPSSQNAADQTRRQQRKREGGRP